MTVRSPSLLRRAAEHYAEHGFWSLIQSGVRFLYRKPKERIISRRRLSRRDLQLAGRAREAIWYADREDVIELTLPDDDQLAAEFGRYQLTYEPDRPFICELPDCHLLGPSGVGLTASGRWISDTISHAQPISGDLGPVETEFEQRVLRLRRKSAPTYDRRRVLPLISDHRSYYHWMVECLPKLRLLELYIERTGHEPAILIDDNPHSFVIQTLELAGYPSERLDTWSGNELHIDSLLVPIHRSHILDYDTPDQSNYQPSRADLHWLRDRLRGNASVASGSGDKRIYVSRQQVPAERGRKVLNYETLERVLDEFRFESYTVEELPFAEQVQLFADADVIMGPHGAGLFNMIFSENPTIVELFPEGMLRPYFYFIAEMMNFEYAGVVTDAVGEDIRVDVDQLRQRLDATGL